MTPAWKILWLVARKEVAAHLRNRWIVTMGGACALLSWLIGTFGFAFAAGRAGPESVLVSLLHLQLYVVPLLGLLLAYDAVQGERDSGMLDVHLALGVGRWTFLAGKWAGLFACLAATLAPSLALQGWAFHQAGGGLGAFAALTLYCALLAGAVTSIGLLLSSLSLERGTVVSLCVGAWLSLAVLADFLVIGVLTVTAGDVPESLLNGLILANPLGSYRLLAYLRFFPGQVEPLLHAQGVGGAVAAAALAAWILVPVGLAGRRLGRLYRPMPIVAEASP